MRRLLWLVILLVPHVVFAQQADDAAADVSKLSRRIMEMRDLLTASDPAVRDAAIETALRDASPAIRGMAIYYALRRYSALPLSFALPEGSAIPRSNLPSIRLERVQWSADGRSLAASGPHCGGNRVSGQVTGDRLRLQFELICVTGGLSGAQPSQPGRRPDVQQYRNCETELTPNPARDALNGALRCPAMPITLPLSLPLG